MLGLPDDIRALLFDLDGVLTRTASIHAAAWKEMFDDFLRERAQQAGTEFEPFALPGDYTRYVDGKPRLDGVRSFVAARGIELSDGEVLALGDRKNALVETLIRTVGVEVFASSVRYVERARDLGLRRAVVSSSKNCREILAAAQIDHLFEAVVDGVVGEREHLPGKPAPDTFLAGARLLDAPPPQCAVFEDALAGVEAGVAGGFGFVIGVDRAGQAEELAARGADVVVADLAELLDEP